MPISFRNRHRLEFSVFCERENHSLGKVIKVVTIITGTNERSGMLPTIFSRAKTKTLREKIWLEKQCDGSFLFAKKL